MKYFECELPDLEIRNSAKPILFNTEMVRAILAGRKTKTRRICKITVNGGNSVPHNLCETCCYPEINKDGICANFYNANGFYTGAAKLPCQPGDILYVRETWNRVCFEYGSDGLYWEEIRDPQNDSYIIYRTDYEEYNIKWRPSIHMPKEAARIFLRVTNVRLERLQDITGEDAVAEGVEPEARDAVGDDIAIGMFHDIWDSTIKKSDLARFGWEANPWVWVYEFERIGGQNEQQKIRINTR